MGAVGSIKDGEVVYSTRRAPGLDTIKMKKQRGEGKTKQERPRKPALESLTHLLKRREGKRKRQGPKRILEPLARPAPLTKVVVRAVAHTTTAKGTPGYSRSTAGRSHHSTVGRQPNGREGRFGPVKCEFAVECLPDRDQSHDVRSTSALAQRLWLVDGSGLGTLLMRSQRHGWLHAPCLHLYFRMLQSIELASHRT